MKLSSKLVLLGLTLLASASLSQAQFIYRDHYVVGNWGTGVVTRFQVWIDAGTNKVTIDIDNNIPRPTSAPIGTNFATGTLISFGFNLPAALGVNDVGDVTMRAKLTSSTSRSNWGGSLALNTWSNDDFWEEHTPWDIHLPATYDQDYGVSGPGGGYGTSDINRWGIRYGEKATFEFSLGNFGTEHFAGFMDRSVDLTAYWENVDSKTYKTGSSGTKWYDNDLQTWEKGFADFRLPSDSELPATPEPSTYGLLGAAALLGLIARRRLQAKKAVAA
jgi:hypothetical protein